MRRLHQSRTVGIAVLLRADIQGRGEHGHAVGVEVTLCQEFAVRLLSAERHDPRLRTVDRGIRVEVEAQDVCPGKCQHVVLILDIRLLILIAARHTLRD